MEIKKDIPLLDWFDWTAIGLATIGVIHFIILGVPFVYLIKMEMEQLTLKS